MKSKHLFAESGAGPIEIKSVCFCLFNLILYVPSIIFLLNRDESSWVEPVLS